MQLGRWVWLFIPAFLAVAPLTPMPPQPKSRFWGTPTAVCVRPDRADHVSPTPQTPQPPPLSFLQVLAQGLTNAKVARQLSWGRLLSMALDSAKGKPGLGTPAAGRASPRQRQHYGLGCMLAPPGAGGSPPTLL